MDKTIIDNVPFYGNTPDNTHCFQASLRMVLEYFQPKKSWTWEELEQLTNKKPNMWTWPMVGLMNVQKRGYEVVAIDNFDYQLFVDRGLQYIEDAYGKDVASMQAEHTDIEQAIEESKAFISSNIHITRPATIDDIQQYLSNGYLVMADVNLKKLNDQPGMDNHMVVIYGIDNETMYLHDPGLPPVPSRLVPQQSFIAAWGFPTLTDASIKVFKKL